MYNISTQVQSITHKKWSMKTIRVLHERDREIVIFHVQDTWIYCTLEFMTTRKDRTYTE